MQYLQLICACFCFNNTVFVLRNSIYQWLSGRCASSSGRHSAWNAASRQACPIIKRVVSTAITKKNVQLLVTGTDSKSTSITWQRRWWRKAIEVTVGGRRAGLSVLQTAHPLSQHRQLSLVMSHDSILSISPSCRAILSPFLFAEKVKRESNDKSAILEREQVTKVWHGGDQNLLALQITAVIIRKDSGETQTSRKWELMCTCHRSDNQGAISVTVRRLHSPTRSHHHSRTAIQWSMRDGRTDEEEVRNLRHRMIKYHFVKMSKIVLVQLCLCVWVIAWECVSPCSLGSNGP